VKALAAQTGKATEDIGRQISAIQAATDGTAQLSAASALPWIRSMSLLLPLRSPWKNNPRHCRDCAEYAICGRADAGGWRRVSDVASGAVETQKSSVSLSGAASDLSKKADDLQGSVEVFLSHLKSAAMMFIRGRNS